LKDEERTWQTVGKYEAVMAEVLEAFSATPRENSEDEWQMTERRVAALARIRAALEAEAS
jgi:hypothetical protein